jgi:hypothetical protein
LRTRQCLAPQLRSADRWMLDDRQLREMLLSPSPGSGVAVPGIASDRGSDRAFGGDLARSEEMPGPLRRGDVAAGDHLAAVGHLQMQVRRSPPT